MMTPERWRKVRGIFDEALELAPERRAGFLEVACSSDPSLRTEVLSLLSADANVPSGFLGSPLPSPLLPPGTRLGEYEIVSQIGAGGMGVVYRARDTRLGRDVAIKVLPGHVSADANRLLRFEQEAQSAAALNHPNILAVYQLGTHQGAPFIVTELLEGETLRELLRQGALVQSRALALAEQIAEGLHAAHLRGIIHRDLKPENLWVTKEGRVKILDFGVAKLLEEDHNSGGAAAVANLPTNPGMIVGTVAYMSPEQVRGEKLDARTDLFSFGTVLYEMVTDERPFAGDTTGVICEAILNRQPVPASQRNARVAPAVDRIISTALEKDRDVRYQSAAEIRADIKRLKRDTESGRSALHPVAIHRISRGAYGWPLLKFVALPLLLLAAVAGIWRAYFQTNSLRPPALSAPYKGLHAQIDAPPLNAFRLTGDTAGPPVISPNAAYVAFTATGKDGKFKLWVRGLDSVEARALPDTDGAYFPFWSPDSSSVGFFADGKLKTINVTLGSAVVVCDASDGRGASWGADGQIVFTPTPTSPLLRVNSTGGSPEPVTTMDNSKHTTHRWPFFLPDKRHFLYFAANHEPSKFGENMIYFASLDGRENRPLFHSETNAVFSAGFLLFAAGDKLMARPFDPTKGEPRGEPMVLARRVINDPVTWHVDASASDAGVLVYGGAGPGSRQLVWLDRSTYTPTEVAVERLPQLFLARLSPQGDRIVLQKDREGHDISVYDLRDKNTLTAAPKIYSNGFPIWSPDGKSIAYGSARDGRYYIYQLAAEGGDREEELLRDDQRVSPVDWKADNLLYIRGKLGNPFECRALSLKTGQTRRVLESVDDCRFSPDGRWIAYATHENPHANASVGPLQIFVTDFPTGRLKHQVSENSGIAPQWSHDGKQLYYLEQSTLSLVRTEAKFSNGVPHFRVIDRSNPNMLAELIYAVSPDNNRILIQRNPDPTVVIVTNFTQSLN